MAVDDRTANLNLPKPHVDNNMRLEEVPRFRALIDQLDTLLNDRPTAVAVGTLISEAVEGLASAAALTALANATVPTSRQVATSMGVEGGGVLDGDLNISLDLQTLTSLDLADTAVQGTRQVYAGTGMQGGGPLLGNITLSLSSATLDSLDLADSALQEADRPYASDAHAEAGDSETVVMNPDKSRHMLDERPPGVKTRYIGTTGGTTPLATDKGCMIVLQNSYAGDVTLPDSLPVKYAITVFNSSGEDIDVVPGGASFVEVTGTGATGTFTVANKGIFTAVHGGSGYWIVSGVGIS